MRNKHQKCRVGWSLIVVLALLLSLVAGSVPTEKLSAAPSGAASVFLDPPSQTAAVGETVTVDIKINHVSNLYGAEVHLDFDPTLLKVVDADPAMDGVQIAPSDHLFPFDPAKYFECPAAGRRFYFLAHQYFIARAEADNDAGTIGYAFTLLRPSPAVSIGPEARVLATITFERLAEGEAQIGFVTVKLADADGHSIPILPENIRGAVIVMPEVVAPTITLSPTEGPPGTLVTVAGTVFAPGHSVNVTFDAETVAILGILGDGTFTGTFTVPDVAAGNYTVTATDAADNTASATFTVVIPTEMVNFSIQPPARSVLVAETFTLDIQVDAGEQPVTGVSAFVDFDPTYLEVMSITPGDTLDVVMENIFDNAAGTVDYSAGTLTEPFPSGTFVVATIEFRALEETAAAAIDFSTSEPRKTTAYYGGMDVTGMITGGIVEVIPDVPVDISMVLQGGARPVPEGWEIPVTINFFEPGADVLVDTPLRSFTVTTVKIEDRAVARVSILPGTYDITVAGETTLMNVRRNVEIALPAAGVDMGTLLEGNANGDHIVNMADFGILALSFRNIEGKEGFDERADFDRNGIVNMADFGLLALSFRSYSPLELP